MLKSNDKGAKFGNILCSHPFSPFSFPFAVGGGFTDFTIFLAVAQSIRNERYL